MSKIEVDPMHIDTFHSLTQPEAPIKILYAEDDADDYDFFELALESMGGQFELLHAISGQSALACLHEAKRNKSLPDLVVLDYNMPGVNGMEALDLIRRDTELSAIPAVIFTTGHTERMFALRKVPVLRKVDTMAEMKRQIRGMLSIAGFANLAPYK
ncbi:response regulator [Chitinophaga horti]|uniref:Response regulator n=1 Tax=Chitinophaga horti TaxID=2920382 RepID=A0ABY6JAU5_9BACT|nr:response regulator [Chitinophaga horti]UYQ95492.1 response regulator [Chitinophaga horti]